MSKEIKKDDEVEKGLTNSELVALANQAKSKSVNNNTEYLGVNEKILDQYLSNPYGDEVEGQSSVVTSDVSDTVEADMTSMVRMFLSANNIVEFVPLSNSEEDVREAREKSEFVNHTIKNQDDPFKTLHDWMKSGLIQKSAAIKYFIDKAIEVDEFHYTEVDESELTIIEESLDKKDVRSIDIVSRTESEEKALSNEAKNEISEFLMAGAQAAGIPITPDQITEEQIEEMANQLEADGQVLRDLPTFDVTFRTITEIQKIKIIGIPTEDFIISEDATSKNDAEVVGDMVKKSRGSLLAEGFDRDLIDSIPTASTDNDNAKFSSIERIRNKAATGSGSTTSGNINSWASEEVELFDLYMKVDFDGDGIAERRHILMAGNEILVNEIFNHVPYALLSSILMPYEAIGRSRAELAQTTQRVKSVTTRQMLNNLYMSNNSRIAANENVDLDDLTNVVPNGIIRVEGDNPINNDIIPVTTQFTGDKSLLILQHLDNSRANSTGGFIANQGLDKDAVSKETATRFEGVAEAGAAKTELVGRVYAETGFKDLFEGIAWMASQYIDEDLDIMVLGKSVTINPENWEKNHKTQPKIVNEEKMMSDLQALYGIQSQLLAEQSPLTDQAKRGNTLAMMVKGLGLPRADVFFNDLNQPEQVLQAQVEQLTSQNQQMQAALEQVENPLKEAEEIKANAALINAQSKQNSEAAKLQEQQRQFDLKFAQQAEQFNKELAEKQSQFDDELAQKQTELVVNNKGNGAE